MALEGGIIVLFELTPKKRLQRSLFSSSVERIRRFRPVENLGERSLPSLLILSQRFRVVREMEKVSTTSLLGIPRSTAARALILRSFE